MSVRAQITQQQRHMPLGIADSKFALDPIRDQDGCPCLRVISIPFRTVSQNDLKLIHLFAREPRFSACTSRFLEPVTALEVQLSGPAIYRLAVHTNTTGNFGLRITIIQQPRRFHAPLFQSAKIPFHSSRISHAHDGSTHEIACDYIIGCTSALLPVTVG